MRRLMVLSFALMLGLQLSQSQSFRLQLEGLRLSIVSIDGSSNGNWLAIVASAYDDDGYLKLWNLADDKSYTPLILPQHDLTSARFVPNHEMFAMLGQLSPLHVFEYRTGWQPIAQFSVAGRTMAVAPNFAAVAVADKLGQDKCPAGGFPPVPSAGSGLASPAGFCTRWLAVGDRGRASGRRLCALVGHFQLQPADRTAHAV
ncbi:MAG: hypothetical protein KatS3mg016_2042 [Fimbriimonadales bacterium]|nr:MAG: hypothetical protein KatS3mg016_2042 [Fimbriimonadales bacterium]